ncbi:MAG: amidohydrolase family protein [Steroidobacteraceae bacterium]
MTRSFRLDRGKEYVVTHPLFDTHAHLISDDWETFRPKALRADLPTPKRTDYTVTAEALIGMMDRHDVPTACVVQRGHLYGYDNSYIIDSARRYPDRLLPVVILDAQDPATPALFTDMVKNQRVRGFRLANMRPSHLDTAWMSSPAAMQVWKTCAELNAPMTLIFFFNQLSYVLSSLHIIAKMFPTLPILIDHLGMAYGVTHVELAWAREAGIAGIPMPPPPDFGINETIRIFEDTPNVHFKLTEVNIENLTSAGIAPARIVRRLADSFGAERLVWGSDVGQSLRWSYAEKASMGRAAADFLDDHERALFLHDNAARIYANTD